VAEIARWRQALADAAAQLAQVRAEVGARIGPSEAEVFEAQALFLQDPALLEPVEALIRDEGLPAPAALGRVWEDAARALDLLDDPYLRARAADLRDVARRLALLLGADTGAVGMQEVGLESIVIARDLTPSDIAGLPAERVRGIVLAEGTPTAHVAILVRGLGLPLVVGVGPAILQVPPGRPLLLDGSDGAVLVDPDARDLEHYAQRPRAAWHGQPVLAGDAVDLPAITQDGRHIALYANAGSVAEARLAREHGAEGIGLLRTEFLLASLPIAPGAVPDEAALVAAYGAILREMGDRPVVVRALDAGGDKPLPFLDVVAEPNPFLGWRGIRVLLDRPDLFAVQVRALLRAAAHHTAEVRLLFPMVSGLEELIEARRLVETIRVAEGSRYPLRIGAMIEVPAAALLTEALAHAADFFSLGTNDLVQYTLACDRGNARVSRLYQPLHPAVLRLIDLVTRSAHAAGRPLSVCGEAAGDPQVVPLLIGLGIEELSVAPNRLSALRQQISSLRYDRLQQLAAEALGKATVQEVRDLLDPP
jgi:phosphoenolpyruvate-protein phosphotransferase